MAFQYACFLSYRHSESDLGQGFVDNFERALQDELKLLCHLDIYRDERNGPGFLHGPGIARALCQSVCMIMIYWPEYFSQDNPYCAREYRGMVALEERRLLMLPDSERCFGLIIPVIVRGSPDHLPDKLPDSRLYAEFTDYSLTPCRPMHKLKAFAPRVRRIAEYVDARYRALSAFLSDPCSDCVDFALPTDAEVRKWLDAHRTPTPYIRGGQR